MEEEMNYREDYDKSDDSDHEFENSGYRETEFRDRGHRDRDDRDRAKKSHRENGYREQRMHKDYYGRGSGAICCFLLVTLIVAAFSVAGLILSLISFVRDDSSGSPVNVIDNRPMPTGQPDSDNHEDIEFVPGPYNPDEVWLIQVGTDGSNLEYLDPVQGVIKGYNVDILNAICRKANKNCRMVLDSYSRCWSGGLGGEGLQSGWYHACLGWKITTDRELTFKFTYPFQLDSPAVFVTAAGSSGQFDWRDLRGKKIGFLQGWFSDIACLNRQAEIQGLPLSSDQIVEYLSPERMEAAMTSGEVDALFIGVGFEFVSRHNVVSDNIQCSKEGAAMMMRKDTFLDKWWNPAWKDLLHSQEYEELCRDIQRVHGDAPGLGRELICRDASHPWRIGR